MEVRSIYKYARISPKKARDVAREIQGLPVSDAIDTLNFTPKKAAFLIGKTLKSAVANAENNHDLVADNLRVKEANVSEGPSFRRFKPRARGSASAIKKRTSHIYIVLTDEADPDAKPARDRKAKAKKKPSPKKETKPAKVEEEAPEEIEEIATAAEEEAPEAEASAQEEAVGAAEEQSGEEAEEAASDESKSKE